MGIKKKLHAEKKRKNKENHSIQFLVCFHNADIAAKLGCKDVCNLTPTAIAIEVSLSIPVSVHTGAMLEFVLC